MTILNVFYSFKYSDTDARKASGERIREEISNAELSQPVSSIPPEGERTKDAWLIKEGGGFSYRCLK